MKTKHRVSIALLLALSCSALSFGTQITAQERTLCYHLYLAKRSESRDNYSVIDKQNHSFYLTEDFQCLDCGVHFIEGPTYTIDTHTTTSYIFDYVGSKCERTYCVECGHIISDRYIPYD